MARGTDKVKHNLLLIAFQIFWMLLLSIAMIIAALFILQGSGGWLIIIGLFLALIGWLFAWLQLYQELRGKPADTGDDS